MKTEPNELVFFFLNKYIFNFFRVKIKAIINISHSKIFKIINEIPKFV